MMALAGALGLLARAQAQVTYVWNNTAGGAWETASNWSPATVPNSMYAYATFTTPGTYTVTLNTNYTLWGIDLNNAGTTLSIGGNTISLDSAGTGSTNLTAGTMLLNGTHLQDTSSSAYTFNNAATINSTAATSFIYGAGTTFTLNNSGLIEATGGTLNLGYYTTDHTVNTGTVEANGAGALLDFGYSSSTLSNVGGTVIATNSGTVDFGSGTTAWVGANGGTITASAGGTVNLLGAFTYAQLTGSTINGSGGTLNLGGTLDLSGGHTLQAPASGIYVLNGGTIENGTIDGSLNALTFAGTSSSLSGDTMVNAFTVPNNVTFTVGNNTTFTGATTFGTGNNVYLAGTVAGTGLTIASGASWTGSFTIQDNASVAMTLANAGTLTHTTTSSTRIYGDGNTFAFNNSGLVEATAGTLYLGYYAGDTITNTGTVEAIGSGATVGFGDSASSFNNVAGSVIATNNAVLNFGSGAVAWGGANGGHITASSGGTVNLEGAFTYAQLTGSTINGTGGTLNLEGTLDLSGGHTLQTPTSGIYVLNGGTIENGTIDGSLNALTFGASSSTLTNDTVANALTIPSGVTFTAAGNTTFTGATTFGTSDTIYLGGTTAGTALTIASGASWTGSFTIQDNASAAMTVVNAGTLTHTTTSSTRIYGDGNTFAFNNSGLVEATAGTLFLGYYAGDTITNTGTVEATGSGSTVGFGDSASTFNNVAGTLIATNNAVLTLGSGTTAWGGANAGSVTASAGGTVNLQGAFTYAQLTGSTINGSGGTLNLEGTLDLSGGHTLQTPTSGIYVLNGGTIENGTIDGSLNALTFGGSSSTLTNDTVANAITIPSSVTLTAAGNTTFTGATTFGTSDTIYLGGTTAGTALTIASGASWTGSFTIQDNASAAMTVVNAGTLTHTTTSSTRIYGNGNTFAFNNSGLVEATAGTLYLGYYSTDTITNTGTVEATGSGSTLGLGDNASTFNNAAGTAVATNGATLNLGGTSVAWGGANGGIITASAGGIVDLGGAFTEAQLSGSTIHGAGGTLNLVGTLTNTSATLNLPISGLYTLDGATINGGGVASGALTFGSGGGTLNGVTLTGDFTMPTGANYGTFHSSGSTTFTGGTTTFTTAGGYDTVYLNSTGQSLDITNSGTWTGEFNIYGQGANSLMTNEGALNFTANTSNINGQGNGTTFTNNGMVTTSNSGTLLNLGYYSNDTIVNATGGTLTANSGTTIDLGRNATAWSNVGTITANAGGTVILDGVYNSASFGGSFNAVGTGVLDLAGTFTNTGTLAVPTTGAYTLDGATINGGGVASGALLFSNSGGVLNNVTLTGNFAMPTGPNYANFHVAGSTTFTGGTTTFTTAGGYDTVYLNSAGQSLDITNSEAWVGEFNIYGQGAGALMTNEGALTVTANTSNINGQGNGMTLTNNGAITASNSGTLLNLGYYSNDTIVNATGGTLTANSGATIDFGRNATAWTNVGTITANAGGTVILDGVYNSASFGGSFNAVGTGVLDLAGTFTNTGTLVVPSTGDYTLDGATINGGVVASGALLFSNSGGLLNNVTLTGNFAMPTGANYAYFRTGGTTTFTGGTTTFTTSGAYDTVYLNSAGQSLDLAASETWTGEFNIYGQVAGTLMTNEGALTATANTSNINGQGSGMTLTNTGAITTSNSGTLLNLGYYSNDIIVNGAGGSITANSGTTIDLGRNASTWSNAGTITANAGGTIILDGNYNNASFGGSINAVGTGILDLAGTFTNTGTLNLPNTGTYTLDGATINGGAVASGALLFTNSGGLLNNVTLTGNFAMPTGPNYAYFRTSGSTTFTGGTTTFTTSGQYDTVYLNTAGQSLDIAASETWTGEFNLYGQGAGALVTNEGALTFTANTSNINGQGNGMTLTNTGAITASNSGTLLNLGYYSNDTIVNAAGGTLTANSGATIDLGRNASTWSNAGTITANAGGTVILDGNYNNASFGGSINAVGTGVLDLAGTFTNTGTLNLPNTGTYTLDGATINGGAIASGALTFSNASGTLNGVALTGNFALPSGATSANFHTAGATSFNGGTTTFSTSSGYDYVYLTGTGSSLTLGSGAVWSGAFSINGQGTTETLNNLGTINLVSTSSTIYGGSGGFSFTNSGTIATTGNLYLGNYSNDSFTDGVTGIVETDGGTIFVGYNQSSVTNLVAGTLTGGVWDAAGGGIISFEGTSPITTNNATLIIDGTASSIRTKSGSGSSYQTLAQTLVTNNGSLEVLGSQNFAATNAVTNNGSIALGGGTYSGGSLTSGSGSSLTGNGTFSPTGGITVGSGVSVSPGTPTANNYVNTLSFNSLTLGGGGSATFDLENAGGAAGAGYDTLAVTGTATITATAGTPFTINLESIAPGTGLPGLATFSSSGTYQWTLVSAGSVSNFNMSDFVINNGSFTNSLGTGGFFVSATGNDIFLNFTPVPEPSTWVLMALGGSLVSLIAWRRRAARLAAS